MGEYSYHTIEEIEMILISIIRITVPGFTIDNVLGSSFCREEILLCCLLAFIYLKYKKRKKQKEY